MKRRIGSSWHRYFLLLLCCWRKSILNTSKSAPSLIIFASARHLLYEISLVWEARAGFNVHRDVQLEAEMAYDFKRNFTQDFSDGVTTQLVNTQFRTLHGFFGPKFQTGSGAFRFFVTGKVGFDNFTVDNQNAPAGFKSTVGLDNGTTDFALYPAAGIEAFAGPIGIRLEAGDDIYFDHGGHNNLRMTLGPQIRF